MSSKRVNPVLPSVSLSDCRFSIFFHQKCFLFFHVEDNGILVECTYSLILTLPNLAFITAHSSFVTAQMGSVTPLF